MNGVVLESHNVQGNPEDIPETKIVGAYGLRRCPKLVEQVCSDNVDVRVSALAVVCDEFTNPYSIQGCMKAGLATTLAMGGSVYVVLQSQHRRAAALPNI